MKRFLGFSIGIAFFIGAAGAHAAPPGPGGTFDCTEGRCSISNLQCPPACPGLETCVGQGTTSCAADDSGCVSHTANQSKCSKKIGSLFCKLVKCVIKCHKKQADMRFKGVSEETAGEGIEEDCEIRGPKSCKGRLDSAIASLTTAAICDPQQLSNAASEEAVLIGHPSPIPSLSLDGQNSGVYCDSTGGAVLLENDLDCQGGTNNGGDCTTNAQCPGGGKCLLEDTGWVPKTKDNLKCEDALGKAIADLVCCDIKCHASMNAAFFAGNDFDEEACEESSVPPGKGCHDRFNKVRDKLLPLCPPCNNQAGWDAQAANATGTVDGANVIVYPCSLP